MAQIFVDIHRRYYIAEEDSPAELQKIIEQLNRRGAEVKTGEIYPTDTVPVLANNKSMVITPFAMKWGYTLPDGKQIINARSETAADKPLFRDGMLQRRCLIPATNYFEWEKRGRDRIKYTIRECDSPILYMAGVYRIENGKPVFSILTREPAENIAFIHNRMPVILHPEAKNDWLNVRYAAGDVLKAASFEVSFQAV